MGTKSNPYVAWVNGENHKIAPSQFNEQMYLDGLNAIIEGYKNIFHKFADKYQCELPTIADLNSFLLYVATEVSKIKTYVFWGEHIIEHHHEPINLENIEAINSVALNIIEVTLKLLFKIIHKECRDNTSFGFTGNSKIFWDYLNDCYGKGKSKLYNKEQALLDKHNKREFSRLVSLNNVKLKLTKESASRLDKSLLNCLKETNYHYSVLGDVGDILLTSAISDNDRKRVWLARQKTKDSDKHINNMLLVRQKIAMQNGFKHYADFRTRTCSLNAKAITKMLEYFLDSTQEAFNAFNSNLEEIGGTDNLKKITPWNKDFVFAKYATDKNAYFPSEIITVSNVCEKVIPMLFKMGGWNIQNVKRVGSKGNTQYVFSVINNQGKLAEVWFSPFNQLEVEDQNRAAYEFFVKDNFLAAQTNSKPTIIVSMQHDFQDKYFDLSELTYLCHEFGHVLHHLNIKNNNFDCINNIPYELVEFPSQLMEALTSSAEFLNLVTLADKKYWDGFFKVNIYEFLEARNSALFALYDLKIHQAKISKNKKVNPKKIFGKLAKKYNFTFDKSSGEPYHHFVWDDYSSIRYIYIIGKFLVHFYLKSNKNYEKSFLSISKTFNRIVSNILSYGEDWNKIERQISKFSNLSFEGILYAGCDKYCEELNFKMKAMN